MCCGKKNERSAAKRVLLSLGSNLGERDANLKKGLERIGKLPGVQVRAVSRCYETVPQDNPHQPCFLNMAVVVETDVPPHRLLRELKAIEEQLGRAANSHRLPRPIDIDIILWEGVTMRSDELTIPHIAFRRRRFVLVPAAEIAPDMCDPETGLSVRELVARPEAEGAVTLYQPQHR